MKINEKHAEETSTYSQTIDNMKTEIKVKANQKPLSFPCNIIIADNISVAKKLQPPY